MNYLLIFLFSLNLYAAANIPSKGNGELFLSTGRYEAKSQFLENKKNDNFSNNGKFTKYELSYFMLYSLKDDLAVFANGPLINHLDFSNNSSAIDFTGSGDQAFGSRYIINKDYHSAIALQALVTFPLYSDNANPGPGNGQNDLELRYLHDLYQVIGLDFISFESALRYRLESPADQLRIDITAGKSVNSILFMGHIFYIQSLKNETGADNNINPYVTKDYDLLKIGPSFAWRYKKSEAIQVGLLSDVHGRNTGNGHYIFLSWWLDFAL